MEDGMTQGRQFRS